MPENHIFLTKEERDLFATYLEQQTKALEALSVQLDKLKLTPASATKYRTESLAARVIAQMLRETEDG